MNKKKSSWFAKKNGKLNTCRKLKELEAQG
jgi:hypothetical protein